MKKWFLIVGGAMALIVMLFTFILSKGEFVMDSTSYLTEDAQIVEERLPFYIGYGLHWNGIGSPTLTDVTLLRSDGTELHEDDVHISVTSMVDKMGVTGVIDEETVMSEGYTDEYIPVKDYKIIDHFLLVFRVEIHDQNDQNDLEQLKIEYKNFGQSRQQTLYFPSFIKDVE
ncbi:hypothetical protein [Bacillus sp. FJAT-45037]|uniref:hypothetical protein n=1 Tax=Bacillus sp. FJAT-45037 TaxID=2011007 RepID=UPI000C233264|nr:hypothetical protein [Bacillus sp. FJAT-45037]